MNNSKLKPCAAPGCGTLHANAKFCSRECAGKGNKNGANTQKHPKWCTCDDCKPG